MQGVLGYACNHQPCWKEMISLEFRAKCFHQRLSNKLSYSERFLLDYDKVHFQNKSRPENEIIYVSIKCFGLRIPLYS